MANARAHRRFALRFTTMALTAWPAIAQEAAPELAFLEYLGRFAADDEPWYVEAQIAAVEGDAQDDGDGDDDGNSGRNAAARVDGGAERPDAGDGTGQRRARTPELAGAEHDDD